MSASTEEASEVVANKGVGDGDRVQEVSEVSVAVGVLRMLSGCGGGACRGADSRWRVGGCRRRRRRRRNTVLKSGVGVGSASQMIKGLRLTWRGFLCEDIADGDETCVEGPIEHEIGMVVACAEVLAVSERGGGWLGECERLWTLSSGTRYRGGALQDGAGGWLRCQPMATDKDAGRELQAGGNSAGQLGWDVAGSSESASVDSSREWRCACRKGGMQRIGARWDPIAAWQAVDGCGWAVDVVRRLDGSDESWQWVATALCMLASWGADAACLAVTSRRMRAGMS
ncbi:hypothetical protein F5887DRAFT_920507 [Amanita rubescens]|nr:hypothetical protein F5887DRAFT_920507 [Amanita rubescens]